MSTIPAKKTRARAGASASTGTSVKRAAKPATRNPGIKKPAVAAAKKAKAASKTPPGKKAAGAVRAKQGSTAKSPRSATALVAMLAGISTTAVAKATGHGWSYWLRALDKAGAAKLPHKEIVALLCTTGLG